MKKRILALFLLLCTLIGCFGCNGSEENDTTVQNETSSGDDETVADSGIPENLFHFVENGESNFKIVYAASATAIEAVQNACSSIRDMVKGATGKELEISDDLSLESSNEILVGDVLRVESKNVLSEYNLSDADFVIKVTKNANKTKIIILGGSDLATVSAVEYFMDMLLYFDKESNSVGLDEENVFLYDTDAPMSCTILSKSENYVEFVIGGETTATTICRISYTGNGGWRIQTKNREEDTFNDIGASQRLSLSLGEEPVLNLEPMAFSEKDNVVTLTSVDGSRVEITTNVFEMNFYTASSNVPCNTITSISSNTGGSNIAGKLVDEEAIFGTGERFNSTNQRGNKIEMFTKDIWSRADACYMVIPLMCSSRGSGVFVNLYEHMMLDIGSTKRDTWSAVVTGAQMDCYIFTTEQMGDVIYGYSALSGFAEMPEEWTYGMIVCRYSPDLSQKNGGYANVAQPDGSYQSVAYEGVYDMIENMEKYDLPWTGVLAEAWGPYNSGKHNDLKELCDYVHSLGKKFLVYMAVGSASGSMAGYKDEYMLSINLSNGTSTIRLPKTHAGTNNPDSGDPADGRVYLDITNPEAVEWFFDTYWDYLANEIGVDGCKIDFCEQIPENFDINFYDESMSEAGTHHWYPSAFCAMFWDMISSKPDSGMCYTRGGGIGAQRAPYMWAGDQAREYISLKYQLVAMLSSGLSGVPFMSYDMSGYQYGSASQDIAYESQVFLRGTEFTAFSVCMQTHGKVRRSYDFAKYGKGEYAYVTQIYGAYTKLHELLTPYITEYSEIACQTGMPVARQLVLHWQNDKNVYNMDDEYMFGDAFLVAPVLNNASSRKVYLPEGTWRDMNTGKVYTVGAEGQWLDNYGATIAMLPVFYNENTTSKTAKDLLDGIEEIFAYAKSLEP